MNIWLHEHACAHARTNKLKGIRRGRADPNTTAHRTIETRPTKGCLLRVTMALTVRLEGGALVAILATENRNAIAVVLLLREKEMVRASH